MTKHYILLCLTTVILASCKTVSVQNKQYQTTTKKVDLGGVGIHETFDLERTYTSNGIPNFDNKIKVQITPIAFNKRTFNAYSKAKELQPTTINIALIDSLPVKHKFLNIETSDKIGLIQLLNNDANKNIKNYLQNQKDSHVITNISIALNETDMNDLLDADEVFMMKIGIKAIGLQLFSDHRITRTINFNDGVVFAYRASSCCWKENDKHQLEIVDLIEGDNNCPDQTYSSSKRAKKKIDYFNF